jgi:hypothetical protein
MIVEPSKMDQITPKGCHIFSTQIMSSLWDFVFCVQFSTILPSLRDYESLKNVPKVSLKGFVQPIKPSGRCYISSLFLLRNFLNRFLDNLLGSRLLDCGFLRRNFRAMSQRCMSRREARNRHAERGA